MYVRPYVKFMLFLSDLHEALIFSTEFCKIPKYEIS